MNKIALVLVMISLISASDAQECKSKTLNTRKVSALKNLFLDGHSVRIFAVSNHEQIVLADWRNGVNAHLLILERVEQKWRARFLSDELLWGKSWIAIQDVPNRNEKFAIVDHSVEGPGWELIILFSKDFGASWELRGCIKKPHYFALLESFEVHSAKDASVIINHSDSDTTEIPSGLYSTITQDGGRTWSTFRLQFLPAEPVKVRYGDEVHTEQELLLKLPK